MYPENTLYGGNADELSALYLLSAVKQFGPNAFKLVHESGHSARAIVEDPQLFTLRGKRGDMLRRAIKDQRSELEPIASQRARQQMDYAEKYDAQILTYSSPHYPRNVYHSNNPIPVLYARGGLDALHLDRAVACVGSRNIREPYSTLHREFVRLAVDRGFAVISGFALGADTIGHRAASEFGGYTVCVMPCGLQRPFPPENKDLWDHLLRSQRATFISEFPFGMRASSMNLRKRNKLIVALAQGVLVSQSSSKGGAMNAYRFAIEQKKPVATFEPEPDSSSDLDSATSGNLNISASERTDTIAFSRLEGQPSEYKLWLSMLRSSI